MGYGDERLHFVVAVEAQEHIYYALAGDTAIDNYFNAIAMHDANSSETGIMHIPKPTYLIASNFGSLELRQREEKAIIGLEIDYSEDRVIVIQKIAITPRGAPST